MSIVKVYKPASTGAAGALSSDPIVTATGLTLGAYEIIKKYGNTYLSLLNQTDFTVSGGRAVGAADSEYGWTWNNRSVLNAADESSTVAGSLTLDLPAGVAYNWHNTVQDAPSRVKKYEATDQIQHWYSFLGTDATASENFELVSLLLYEDASLGSMMRVGVGWSASSDNQLSVRSGATTTNIGITAGQKGGMWVRLSRLRKEVWASYNLSADGATLPTSWTFAAVNTSAVTAEAPVWVGHTLQNGSGAGAVKGYIARYIDEDAFPGSRLQTTPKWSSVQYSSANPEIQLLADWDLVSTTATLNDAVIQNILTDAVNNLPGDSSTWTFSLKQSSTVSATSGTFQAPGSVTTSGTGRYVSLWAKSNASTGEEAGTLQLPFSLPITAA